MAVSTYDRRMWPYNMLASTDGDWLNRIKTFDNNNYSKMVIGGGKISGNIKTSAVNYDNSLHSYVLIIALSNDDEPLAIDFC